MCVDHPALLTVARRRWQVVGVFMNQPVDEVNRLAAESGIDIVQLHGDEDIAYMEAVSKPVMKVVHVPAGTTVDMVPSA